MNKPFVKKSPSFAAFAPKGHKGSMAIPIATPGAAVGTVGEIKVFRATATTALGTVAAGAVKTFAKDR